MSKAWRYHGGTPLPTMVTDSANRRAACQATFEPCPDERDRPGTHTCYLHLSHAGPHICPRCGVSWLRRPSAPRGRIVADADSTGGRS